MRVTLQEKILEALGERALPGCALYQALSGENAAAVDVALGQLMKRGLVTKELGAYQRANHRGPVPAPVPTPTPAAPKPAPRPAPAASTALTVPPARAAQPGPKPHASGPARLTAGERAVLEMVSRGMTSKMIGEELHIQKGTVDFRRWSACQKLGLKGKSELIAWLRKNTLPTLSVTPAPSATAPKLTAAPSHEGAEAATVGAGVLSIGGAKEEAQPPAPRYSPDLRARLIQVQQAKAEQLQWLLKIVDAARQELRDIEAMVRGVSEEQA